MEYEHSAAMLQSFDSTQAEMRRPFYLCRATMHHIGTGYFEARCGDVTGIGVTPQIAAIAFDLVWLNGSIEKAAQASKEPNMDAVKTREINTLVTENRALLNMLAKASHVLTEFGQITDESRVGWCIKEIDSVLGGHGHPASETIH